MSFAALARTRPLGFLLLGALALGWAPDLARAETRCTRVEMFSRPGCPHCRDAQAFLEALAREQPALRIEIHDVASDPAARAALLRAARRHGVTPVGVPAFVLCDVFLVGFRDAATTGREIRVALTSNAPGPRGAPFALPWLGPLDPDQVGLAGFTVAIGLLDGFNPCAMWVLLILLSVLVGIRDRRRLVLVAGTFVAVSGIAYFVFMAAWLNVFLWIGWSRPLQIALGGIAVGVGAFHVKDLFAPWFGPSLSIPQAAKPGIYRRLRAILRARGLFAALLGALALAVTVNAVELLCTAGLPAIYTQILTLRDLPAWHYYGYLALYNLAYLTDDLVVVSVAVVTLRRFPLQERHGRWLKGLSGALMLGLGLVLWIRPSWLTA